MKLRLFNNLLQNKSFSLKAEGHSMLPILHSGDVVRYRKTAFKNIKINDLVLVKKNNKLFTHRVIYKAGYLITKGDNNPESDGKIYPRDVIAKVQSVKRSGKEFDPNQIYLFQSSLYLQEIIKIKNLFEKQNIDFVFLKGLPLHLYYEGEHPRRIYADCDVLINPKDKNEAERILKKQRYIKTDSSFSKIQSKLQDREIEITFYKSINGFIVNFDVHYEVTFLIVHLGKLNALYHEDNIKRLTETFLQRKQQVLIHNEYFFILNKNDLIVYLVLHFFHHNHRGAFRLEFLDKIICKSLDSRLRGNDNTAVWDQVGQIIKTYRLQNFVYPVFVLLKKYYQTPIPSSFLKSIRPSSIYLQYLSSIFHPPFSIFNDEPRIGAGIRRFKNLFFLSPEPLWRKVMVIFNPQVLYTGVWLVVKKLLSLRGSRRTSADAAISSLK